MEDNSFNESLGKRLKAERATFQPSRHRARMVTGVAIAAALLVAIYITRQLMGY